MSSLEMSRLWYNHSFLNLQSTDYLMKVLDEADSLFDDTFIPEIEKIIQILQKRTGNCQFILVGATFPKVHSLDLHYFV